MASLIFRNILNVKCIIRGQLLNVPSVGQISACNCFHSIVCPQKDSTKLSVLGSTPGNYWSLTSIRTIIRNNWPRPSEKKRMKMNFWNRMKTRGGRAILMRRYLKGRHVLSH